MQSKQDKLKSNQVQAFVLKKILVLLKFVPLELKNLKTKLDIVINILLLASVENRTINRVCKDRKNTPTGTTVRNILKMMFTEISTLEQYLNRALKSLIKRKYIRNAPVVSCDLVLIEYYGKEEKNPDEIKRGVRRNGTDKFHAYATVYINIGNQRYTLAITYVCNHETMLDVIKRLNRYVISYGIKPSLWLMDKGFYGVNLLRWFQQHKKGYIMPMPHSGRKVNHPKGPSSVNVYQTWKTSGLSQYTMNAAAEKKSVTTDVAVYVRKNEKEEFKVKCYAHHLATGLSSEQIHKLYKTRFAIESSYRQMKQAKAQTASKSPLLRYMMVGISLVLRNAWIFIHFNILYKLKNSIRLIETQLFSFITMLSWIKDVINSMFPIVREVEISDSKRLKCLYIDF